MTDTAKTPEQIALDLDAKRAEQKAAREAKKAEFAAMTPVQKAQAKIDKANADIAKAQAELEKADSAKNGDDVANLFHAWADAKGHSNAKGNRRASHLALITEWEADIESGLVKELANKLNPPEPGVAPE